jgi:hypothetical protein
VPLRPEKCESGGTVASTSRKKESHTRQHATAPTSRLRGIGIRRGRVECE